MSLKPVEFNVYGEYPETTPSYVVRAFNHCIQVGMSVTVMFTSEAGKLMFACDTDAMLDYCKNTVSGSHIILFDDERAECVCCGTLFPTLEF